VKGETRLQNPDHNLALTDMNCWGKLRVLGSSVVLPRSQKEVFPGSFLALCWAVVVRYKRQQKWEHKGNDGQWQGFPLWLNGT